jgi:hypothetical protein
MAIVSSGSWMSVEDLTRLAFHRSRIVMVNEAHDGLTRCVRTRQVGIHVIKTAHELGVRRLAMEALPRPPDGTAGPIRQAVSVAWPGRNEPWLSELLASLADTLQSFDGTAGILQVDGPELWNDRTGVDAIMVSTLNELT